MVRKKDECPKWIRLVEILGTVPVERKLICADLGWASEMLVRAIQGAITAGYSVRRRKQCLYLDETSLHKAKVEVPIFLGMLANGWMRSRTAAERLGVLPGTVSNYLSTGAITGTKVGGVWWIPESEILRWRRKRGEPKVA